MIFLSRFLSSGGVDFDSGPYIVVMPRGSTRVTVSIPIIDDDWYEGPEHFTARIETNSSSAFTPGPRDEAVISVSDNDCECHSAGLCAEVMRLVSVEGQSRNTVTVHIICRKTAPCFSFHSYNSLFSPPPPPPSHPISGISFQLVEDSYCVDTKQNVASGTLEPVGRFQSPVKVFLFAQDTRSSKSECTSRGHYLGYTR